MKRSSSQQSNRSDGPATSDQESAAKHSHITPDDTYTSDRGKSDTDSEGDEPEDALQRANRLARILPSGFSGNPPRSIIESGKIIKNQVIHSGKIVSQDIAYGSPRSKPSSRPHSTETKTDIPLVHTQSENSDREIVSWGDNGFPVVNVAGGKLTINGKTVDN